LCSFLEFWLTVEESFVDCARRNERRVTGVEGQQEGVAGQHDDIEKKTSLQQQEKKLMEFEKVVLIK